MEEVAVDKAGRLVLPKPIRTRFDTSVFTVEVVRNTVVLKPRRNLLCWFGKFPDADADGFLRWKKEESGREDAD